MKPAAFFATGAALLSFSTPVIAGPIAWGLCQTACNLEWGTCLGGAALASGELQTP
jgi:hypothetical protein